MAYKFSRLKPPVFKQVCVHPKHDETCPFKDSTLSPAQLYVADNRAECKCWKSCLFSPGSIRLAANTQHWKAAEDWGRNWVKLHDPNITKGGDFTPRVIFHPEGDDAWGDFMKMKTTGGKQPGTIKKINTTKRSLHAYQKDWNEKHKAAEHLIHVDEINLDHLERLAAWWDDHMPKKKRHNSKCNMRRGCSCPVLKTQMSVGEKNNRRGILREFFDYCIEKQWIANNGELIPRGEGVLLKDNPANFLRLSGAKARAVDKMPMTDQLWSWFIEELGKHFEERKCTHTDPNGYIRARIFFETQKKVGFSLTDLFIAKTQQLGEDENGYYLETERLKTKKTAKVHIKKEWWDALHEVPSGLIATHPDYIFWWGPDPEIVDERELRKAECDAADGMGDLFTEIIKRIGPEKLHSKASGIKKDKWGNLILPTTHCLRYNFAEDFLARGGSMEDLAIALGDTLAVAEKHYAKLSPKREANVAANLKRGWEAEEAGVPWVPQLADKEVTIQ